MTPNDSPKDMGSIDPARSGGSIESDERIRLVRVFARHLCSGTGPSGEFEPDWEPVVREALRRLAAGPERVEKGEVHAAVMAAMIETSRAARRRRPRAATGDAPGAGFLGILSLLSEEGRQLVQRAFLQAQPYAVIAREFRMEEAAVREQVAQGVRRARLIATGRGAE